MEQKHSPLSWRLTSQMNRFSVKSHNELFIASDIRQLDDAQFIVHACNNFDSLLEACSVGCAALRILLYNHPENMMGRSIIDQLQAAIIKAEAKGGDVQA